MFCYLSRPKIPYNIIRTCPTCGYFLGTHNNIPQKDIIELVDKDITCSNCTGGTIRSSGVCAWHPIVPPFNANTFNLGSNLLNIQSAYLDTESRLICSCDKKRDDYSVMSCDYRYPFVCMYCGYLFMLNGFKQLSDDVSKLMTLLYQAQFTYLLVCKAFMIDVLVDKVRQIRITYNKERFN